MNNFSTDLFDPTGTTTPSRNGPGSNVSEGVLHTLQICSIRGDGNVSYPSAGDSQHILTPANKTSSYILAFIFVSLKWYWKINKFKFLKTLIYIYIYIYIYIHI